MSSKKSEKVPSRYRLGDFFVPKDRYVDPEFLELEYERIFGRAWQMACRLEEIPNSGDYLEYQIGNQSILVPHGIGYLAVLQAKRCLVRML